MPFFSLREYKRFIVSAGMLLLISCSVHKAGSLSGSDLQKQVRAVLQKQIMEEADWAMQQQPITVTAESSPLSTGGNHDFFSQADYFWPDPKNPDGPYINRDGQSNPDNFSAHRKAMIRFSKIMGALASAYKLTGDQKYVQQAVKHLRAWFIDPETLMNPNLKYAQAVKGLYEGRSYGIIDTIHFMEVAQAVIVMENDALFDKEILTGIKKWFAQYIVWLNTSKNGIDEKNAKNNHSVCWAMQVASFARLCGDNAMLDTCRNLYKNVFLPNQMGIDGSFPQELARTKPYGYSIFNLDAMVTLCQIVSTTTDNLWNYEMADGRSIKKGITYLYPFIADKSKWTGKKDIMYWDNWPVAQPFLIFGANQYKEKEWFTTWKQLDHQPTVAEVIRNVPIRHPLIWL